MTTTKILTILMERGESLLNEHGVDRLVALDIAQQIASPITFYDSMWAMHACAHEARRNVRYYLDHRRRSPKTKVWLVPRGATTALKMAKVFGQVRNTFRNHINATLKENKS